MILTIDTTQPLNDVDRAVLRALIGPDPAPVRSGGHAPAGARPNSAEGIAGLVTGAAGLPRRTDAGAFAVRGPVSSQPGVTLTESVHEEASDGS